MFPQLFGILEVQICLHFLKGDGESAGEWDLAAPSGERADCNVVVFFSNQNIYKYVIINKDVNCSENGRLHQL